MSDTQEYLSADELLAGVVGGTIDCTIEGLGKVKLRALEYMELKEIAKQSGGDDLEAGFLIGVKSLEQPQLTKEQVELLRKAKPGAIATIVKKARVLSGMSDPEETEKNSGGGS